MKERRCDAQGAQKGGEAPAEVHVLDVTPLNDVLEAVAKDIQGQS